MNAVEIEEAVSKLAEAPYDAASFPYDFLQAFGQNDATIRKLKSGEANKSDLTGPPKGVLQRNKNNIHILACGPGEVEAAMRALRQSPATAKHKARFILATDGQTIQAERFDDGEVLACDFRDLPNRFTFFLPLAGISTVKRIDENAFDIRATGRLNKLYVELLKVNPDWDTESRREDLNHFFARLIFCFFAEDTSIFIGERLFTSTIEQMTERNGSNVHEVLSEVFRAMNIRPKDREAAKTRPYADSFPYVNGNLFDGSTETPRFNQAARNYLLFVGNLDWTLINPDIFGSMIQAVADDEERGALGMHYTSVPNILKVLNPLFLDDLRAKLDEAGDGKTPGSARKLLNLRNRLARIRVFDPACGSGNFLVIAYKEMRQIEHEINQRRGEAGRTSEIPISNFRGIELRHFPAEIARLALIIAEFQCDVLYRGELFAQQEFLPLDAENWITCGNALQIDWTSLWPPESTGVILQSDDLFGTPKDQVEIDFERAGGETYICGNPPYKGNARKSSEQKQDLKSLFAGRFEKWGLLDYVCAWFYKAMEYAKCSSARFAFVATNSVVQGQHVANFWRPLFERGLGFFFAVRSFKWSNLAANDAGVTVVIVGAGLNIRRGTIYDGEMKIAADNINAYLLPQENRWVTGATKPISRVPAMVKGNYYGLSEHLLMGHAARASYQDAGVPPEQLKRFYGSAEVINGKPRYCFWLEQKPGPALLDIADIGQRIAAGERERSKSRDAVSNGMAGRPHQFREMNRADRSLLAIPVVSSENREYLPIDLLDSSAVISNKCFALYDAPLWTMALVASRLHLVWISTVCVRLEMRFSYSNILGWNTFPVPMLTDENKAALTRCAEDILLAREAHFPATIAEMYDPEAMDTKYPDLRAAHDRNDETLERIYIGRRFRNDTERLEKLFEMYTQMTAKAPKAGPANRTKSKGT